MTMCDNECTKKQEKKKKQDLNKEQETRRRRNPNIQNTKCTLVAADLRQFEG